MRWKKEFSKFTGRPQEEYKPLVQIIIATIMTMDLAQLRLRVSLDEMMDDFLLRLFIMPCFIKTMMNKKRNEQLSDESYDNKVSKPEVIRDKAEKHERVRLDEYRCIVLRTGNAEVYHIVPFSVNSKEEYRSKMAKYFTRIMGCIFHFAPGYDEETIDIDNDDPEADKAWNEISLNCQLHKWWDKGFLAFEPLGIDHEFLIEEDTFEVDDTPGAATRSGTKKKKTLTRVKLQFHWMPRRKDIGSEAPPLTTDTTSQGYEALESMLGKTYGDLDSSNPVFAHDRQDSICHHLRTGDIFYVKVETRYANHMLTAFKLQWACIKIFSIASGAEALKDVGGHPDYLDENLEWIGYPHPPAQELFLASD
ncbi:hypothetical protein B0T25DRAFT_578394 [Lasiosphaeria hispida]|uniref:HNH nuclease domain-containing protein n=1 Tax=Lasiosphaeria hispida TaxID=260671 RepID=A0AAJ0HSH8_9PEZI|nr:hypothetical protein B0T25DRAFT_578394 [Lasiosphaeria hispida]